jgi:two-component system sensor histidine kinase KdpD
VASSRVTIRLPRLSLLGKFALVSLIPIVLLGLVLAKTLQIQIRNQALRNARQLAAAIARLDIQPQLTRDDLIATVSHEFRTPLTIIEGVSSTLQRHDLVAGDGHSLLDSLRNASHRLRDLVEALLATAEGIEREAEVERRPVAVSEVIQGVVDGLSSFDARSRVRVIAIPDGDTVMSDPAMLTPLLRHIIENALKFSPLGSAVDISIARTSGEVEVRVRDRGPGIDPAFMERAFDPFTQEDQSSTRAKSGLGIGLFAARKIADLIGGRVELQHHPAGGMEAILHLPDTVEDRGPVTAEVDAEGAASVAWPSSLIGPS